MEYWVYHFQLEQDDQKEVLLAMLSQLPFEAFEEHYAALDGYLPAAAKNDFVEEEIRQLMGSWSFTWTAEPLPEQNWNAVWEANFEPVLVDNFCYIRADFHPPMPGIPLDITINPKMAFGTGHHATTYMMVQLMRTLDFKHKRVFDFGCGTGVLAIIAAKLGTTDIKAVDIELAAIENTFENMQINHIDTAIMEVFAGGLEVVPVTKYDIILANINRNVILASLPALHKQLKPDGTLLISGILQSDETLVKEAATQAGFSHQRTLQREDWLAMQLRPNS
ncbi:MAG: 50S ribosomal protein L11 methyltransferase [Lewinellaceae bacterium]|nr:50S ribosomal protein L11 methyltransferase [Lewinellaceae bacterium]